MDHNELRIGRVVQPVEPAAMECICPTYHPGVSGGVIVGLDPRRPNTADVVWIDHSGPQRFVHTLHHAQLTTAPIRRRRAWLRRRARRSCDQMTTVPTLRIRNLKVYADCTDTYTSGLTFHCVADANAALHEIAAAKADFLPEVRRDTANPLPGALVVLTHWALHTDVYRIEAHVTD